LVHRGHLPRPDAAARDRGQRADSLCRGVLRPQALTLGSMPRRSRGMLSGARTPQLFRIGPLVDEIPGMNHTMENPSISVIVCTRNRGASVAPTIQSILGNTHHSFEVILIDQS